MQTLIDGYNKKTVYTVRPFTIEDIKNLADQWGEFRFIDTSGFVRRCRKSSALKTWKKDPTRFECSFKYGLYDNVRWTTDEMLSRLVVIVGKG